MTTLAWLILIYTSAVFFWLRYLYNHSLRKSEDRLHLFDNIKRISWFIPIGLQAIFLFCFAVVQVIPLVIKLSDFIELIFFRNVQTGSPDFESLRIITIGSVLLALQYLLLKKNFFGNQALNWLVKFSVFMTSIILLRVLISNIIHSLSFFPAAGLSFNYNNNYVWLLCIVLLVIVTVAKRLKHLSLASGILIFYLSLVFIIAVPRIIFTVIQHMQ